MEKHSLSVMRCEWKCADWPPAVIYLRLDLLLLCIILSFSHSLCVLLLSLASLLHLARLFENQTFATQTEERLYLWRGVLMIKNGDSTLIMSSGSLISADSFSLVCISAYWLWQNSDLERYKHILSAILGGKCSIFSFFFGIYLVPVLCSAPEWTLCGFGAQHVLVSDHCCTLSCDWFLLELETQNLRDSKHVHGSTWTHATKSDVQLNLVNLLN